MIIYKATNKIDGKCYIGQSTFSLEKRKHEHLKGSRRIRPKYYIHRAIKKHGMNNFTWEVLAECETRDEMNKAEMNFIQQYSSLAPNGYNSIMMATGGDLFSQFSESKMDRVRKNISEGTLKGIAKSDKSWSHFGKDNSMYGRKHSPDSIEKMRNNRKGLTAGEKNPAAINAPSYIIRNPDGEIFEIKNQRKYCRDNNIPRNWLRNNSYGWNCKKK